MAMQTTTYDALVGYNANGSAVILLYTFDYGDGFKGATGAILELVSKGESEGEHAWIMPAIARDSVSASTVAATNCVASGRIFPEALDDIVTWVRPDLADAIYEAEK